MGAVLNGQHQAHKDRLNRMNAAGLPEVSQTEIKSQSETVQGNKYVQESRIKSDMVLIHDLRAQVAFLEKENQRLLDACSQGDDATPRYPTLIQIKRAVSESYGVPIVQIEGAHRDSRIVEPRHVAIHLARRLTLLSLPLIGRRFGNRDHTSCMHADRKIAARRQAEPAFDAKITELERLLKPE